MKALLTVLAFVVIVGALLAGAAILEIERRDPRPKIKPRYTPPKPTPYELLNCFICGDAYHEGWGDMCPNCSGAD